MSLRPHPLETLLTALAGWLPVLGGITLLGMTLITPEWVGWRELLWQRDMLRLQAEGLKTQRASYETFHEALAADDPVLLERLAYTHLRYKPADKQFLDGVGDHYEDGEIVAVGHGGDAWSAGQSHLPQAASVTPSKADMIESWLSQPQPVIGQDIPALKPMNTRLTRLTRGASRYVLLAVGIICLVAGLWPEKMPKRATAEAWA